MTFKTTERNTFKGLEMHQERHHKPFPFVQVALVVILLALSVTLFKMCQEPKPITLAELNNR